MSKAEIIAELSNLKPEDRQQVLEHLCDLQEIDVIQGALPTEAARPPLDESLAEFERDGNLGEPYEQVFRELRDERDR